MLMLEVLPAVPLIGRVLSNPSQFVDRVYKKHLQHVASVSRKPFAKRSWTFSGRSVLAPAFHGGSMTHVLTLSSVLPLLSGQPVDRHALMRRLVNFIAAGLRAPSLSQYPMP